MSKGLLIITQKVDQDEQVLGFFIPWIAEFAKHYRRVTVGCLNVGRYSLPDNVSVVGFGKDQGYSKIRQVWNFYKLIITARREYDHVFVHMTPIWVVLGGWFWRLAGKRISLWYAHGTVTLMLRGAERWADIIFTSTPGGCRIGSPKIRVVGQGINTDYFRPGPPKAAGSTLKIVTVGRISPSKDYETLISAVAALPSDVRVSVEIVGGAGKPEDEAYIKRITVLVKERGLSDRIVFRGPVPNRDVLPILQGADMFVNMGQTGSLDKAIVEAMACGLPVLTCNEALGEILRGYGARFMYPKHDFRMLAGKIRGIAEFGPEDRAALSAGLREIVVKHHNLPGLIERMARILHDQA